MILLTEESFQLFSDRFGLKKYDVRLFFELKEVNEAVILGMSKIQTENSLIIQHFKNKKICPRQRTLMLLNSLKP